MNRRMISILVGLLAALLVWVLVVERPWTDDIRGPSSRKGLLFKSFDPASAVSIEVRASGATTRLEKEGGTWVVAGPGRFRADQKAIGEMMARVDTLVAGEVASINPDKRGLFGVDSTGVQVTISGAGGPLARFWVGNSTADFSGLYLRVDGKDEVYPVSHITRFQFDRGQQTWRDRQIVPVEAEEIRRLTLAWADTTVTLTRQGSDSLKTAPWTVRGSGPGQADSPARAEIARSITQGFATLLADGFPAATDTVPASWQPLSCRFEIEAANGQTTTIEVGPSNAQKQHYVRRVGNPDIYLLGPWRFSRFKKGYDELTQPAGGAMAAPAPSPLPAH